MHKINDNYIEPLHITERGNTMARVLFLSDQHHPYCHPEALDFAKRIYEKYDIDTVINGGDEVEHHALSFHMRRPDMPSAQEELKRAIEHLQPWYETFPEVTVMESNHTSRPFRVALNAGLPTEYLKEYKEFLKAPKGWNWAPDITIDEVLYMHGEGAKGGAGGAYATVTKYRQSVVHCHMHSFAGIQWSATKQDMLFCMNAGCIIDPDALAFAYAKNFPNRPTLGLGVVIDGIPYFEPMPLGTKIKRLKKTRKVLI